MKIGGEKDAAFRTNIESTKGYTIKAGAKAFAVLSAQLYKNPIKAIIRELSCNAIDAHRAAGNPEPFNVYLPNSFSDEFVIEDFGIGMSPETMDTLYHTYFESTKENDDDDIGGFGIGSKTPFAYTSLFNVRSVKDGVETVSISFLNSDKVPQYNLVRTSETTDRNGTRVSFSVKKEDYSRFYGEAVAVLAFLPQMPRIKSGGDELVDHLGFLCLDKSATTEEALSAFDTFRAELVSGIPGPIVNSFIENTIGGAVILMGGVPYRLDLNEAFKNDEVFKDDYSKIRKIRNFYDGQKIINVKIGDVVVQPSREELAYEERTISTIKKCFGSLFVEYFDKLLAAKSLYEKFSICKKYPAQTEFLSDYGFYLNNLDGSISEPNVTELKKLLGETVTDEVSAMLFDLKKSAVAFNAGFNGLTDAKKLAKKTSETLAAFHNPVVPVLLLSANNRLKTDANQSIWSAQGNWTKDWNQKDLLAAFDDMYTCTPEFWKKYLENGPTNVDSKKFNCSRREVLERTNSIWRQHSGAIEILNPGRVAFLKKHGFPVDKMWMFDEVDKVTYKLYRSQREHDLDEITTRSLYNPLNLKNASGELRSAKWKTVAEAAEKEGAKIYWAIVDVFQDRSYYSSSDTILFIDDDHVEKKRSKSDANKLAMNRTFLSHLDKILEAERPNDNPLKNSIVVGITYLDAKVSKLLEDKSDSLQALVAKVFTPDLVDSILRVNDTRRISGELDMYVKVKTSLKKKINGLTVSDYEKMLGGVSIEKNKIADSYRAVQSELSNFLGNTAYTDAQTRLKNVDPDAIKKAIHKAYPMLKYLERSMYYGVSEEKVFGDYADYVIERDSLPSDENPRLVAPATEIDQMAKASA